MRQIPLTTYPAVHQQAAVRRAPQALAATDDQERLRRGVVNGSLLALAVWISAGYLAFILR